MSHRWNRKTLKRIDGRSGWVPGLAIVLVAAIITVIIFNTEPEAKREGATRKSAMLVDTLIVKRQDYQPSIKAMGVVTPAQQVALKSRVSGEVVQMDEAFVPGALIARQQPLIQLDTDDYQLAVQQANSELTEAQSTLSTEMGEQERAKNVYQSLNTELSAQKKALVLRQPQLLSAQARVTAAKANLAKARLDLKRTEIHAPFDAQVVSREVSMGSQVSAGDTLARLIGVDEYWIEASVPLNKMSRLKASVAAGSKLENAPENSSTTKVTVRDHNAWPKGYTRQGQFKHLVSELEQSTRMLTVLVSVDDPLGLSSNEKPLVAGSFVEVALPAKTLSNVIRLPRQYLRKNDTLWLLQDDALAIKSVEVVFRDEQFVYLASGIMDSAEVITTDLSTVKEGAAVARKSGTSNNPQTVDGIKSGSNES